MTLQEISYKDLDTHGHYSVDDVELTLESQYGVPVLMSREQYVHHAAQFGMHRVLHGRTDEKVERRKFAREVTRHLNWHYLNDPSIEQDKTEEHTERFWK